MDQERLKQWGLSNVHGEPFDFGRGWTLEKFSVEMIEPRYMPLSGYPRAWSASTIGNGHRDAGLDAEPLGRRSAGTRR